MRWLAIATRTATMPRSTVSVTTATPLSCTRITTSWLTASSAAVVDAAAAVAQADDVAADRRQPLELGVRVDGRRRGDGRRADGAVDDRAERVGAVRAEAHPHPQRPEPAGERQAVLGEPHLAGGDPARRVGEVGGDDGEGGAVGRLVAHEDEPDVDRRLHPLVEVEGERVGPLDARARRRRPAEGEEAADRAVDVEPQALPLAEVGDRVEVVERAGVDRAGAGDDGERLEPGRRGRR